MLAGTHLLQRMPEAFSLDVLATRRQAAAAATCKTYHTSSRNVINAGAATLQEYAMLPADACQPMSSAVIDWGHAACLGAPLWPGALQHALAVCTWSWAWYSTLGHALNLHTPAVNSWGLASSSISSSRVRSRVPWPSRN